MKRYHEETRIISKRKWQAEQLWGREHHNPGSLRKTHLGCNKASCQLCHPEKFPRRIPTRQEMQSIKDLYEQSKEL